MEGKSLESLMKERGDLFINHQILITCFSCHPVGEKESYRLYFNDLNTGYIHNPMIKEENGKKHYQYWDSYQQGLSDQIEAAHKYLESKSINK